MELLPKSWIIGILINPASADAASHAVEASAASATLKLLPVRADARSPAEISSAFRQLRQRDAQVVVALYDALFFSERKYIAELALAEKLPVVYAARDHVTDGGLISYGISLRANAHRMTVYIDKILKGRVQLICQSSFPPSSNL